MGKKLRVKRIIRCPQCKWDFSVEVVGDIKAVVARGKGTLYIEVLTPIPKREKGE